METDFTRGKIVPALLLLRFVFPIIFAMLIQSLYGAVDLMIVGQFSDAANVSAVSVGSQIMQTVTLVFTELAVGTTVLLGHYIGQGRLENCSDVVGATLFSFTIMGIAVAIAMQWLAALSRHTCQCDLCEGYGRLPGVGGISQGVRHRLPSDLVPVLFYRIFHGCAKTGFVMLQGIVGVFCVRVPLSVFFSRIEPVSVFRIGLATPSSSFIQIVLCFFFFFLCRKKYMGQSNQARKV